MTVTCVGDPPMCCQPAISAEQQARMLDRFESIAATFAAETPKRCPWCGSRSDVIPVFATDRRTWICDGCKREFTPGGIG